MWTAIVLELEVRADATAPRTLGMAAHGWFLRHWLAPWAPALADAAHSGSAPRPFTLSDVRWPTPLADGEAMSRAPLRAGQRAELRVATVDPAIGARLVGPDAALNGAYLDLDGVPLRIRRVWRDAAAHPDAGRLDPAAAVAAAGAMAADGRDTTVRFVSPTHFRQDGRLVRTPTARLLFGSWLRRWNAFHPDHAWPEALEPALGEACGVEPLEPLRDRRVVHGAHMSEGFEGGCLVRLPDDGALRVAALALLTSAFWSGTGKGTVWGLGQTRPAVARLAIGAQLGATAHGGADRGIATHGGTGRATGAARAAA